MDLSSNLTTLDMTAMVTVVALAVLGALISTAVIAKTVATNRHERISRQESLRTYYGRQLSPSH
ncbi:hypothetical protein [Nocardioides sp. SR21]|uniref:hypothetical protein n=1 Tax=Nocardioides sp. SR21 TaxID=2919501 RepID=UPI001FA9B4D1|nr:hypothetical protein [Nocardioides sp. SR21]